MEHQGAAWAGQESYITTDTVNNIHLRYCHVGAVHGAGPEKKKSFCQCFRVDCSISLWNDHWWGRSEFEGSVIHVLAYCCGHNRKVFDLNCKKLPRNLACRFSLAKFSSRYPRNDLVKYTRVLSIHEAFKRSATIFWGVLLSLIWSILLRFCYYFGLSLELLGNVSASGRWEPRASEKQRAGVHGWRMAAPHPRHDHSLEGAAARQASFIRGGVQAPRW